MTVTSKIVNSAMFAASAKIISKVLGLFSTMVLARLLAPEQFGLIAIVSIALYFFDILSHTASEQYIIQKSSVTKKELGTAWTANLVLKSLICVLIVLSAPWVALFFERPVLTNAIRVSALILPLQALKSPIYILLKRQLKFAPLFWSSLAERLFAVPLLIGLAIILQSYWAFIITDIVAGVLAVGISYFIAKRRPVFTVSGLAVQWTFSKWMLAKSIVGYARSQIDTVVVSKAFSAAMLGNYHMARELAMMPAHFILGPAIDPLLSAFKNDKNNKAELLNNVAFTLIVVFLISIPLCAYLWAFSPEIVLVLLGKNWSEAGALLSILSFLFLYWSMLHVVETALIAQSKVRLIFYFDLFSLCFIAGSLIVGVNYSLNIYELAWIRVVTGLLGSLILLVKLFEGYLKQLVSVVWIFLLIVIVSYIWGVLVSYQATCFANFPPWLEMFVSGLELMIILTLALTALWRVNTHYHIARLISIARIVLFKGMSTLNKK
ncbi:oligosaccharide flippase family protein [Alteromonas sp. 1_MG-2023]|uniref:oligosaccharide flippase family protein n=1 Tax=Alteromonas sp. 1_MG-2023 TaxID=3062669 RepID=UPI0026E1F5E2|nr:oligosaccharide flippase family protein [Alteromonas sp. 1_MG-2023]MDO6566335.1 oligosaccharide flippase family protein [Alteromonas sp. 1_MG-2023]